MMNLRRFGFALALLLISTQAQSACWQWSRTTSANATADPTINWSVGMAPSAVDASGRAMMSRSAECRDDLSGLLLTTGTSTAFAVTTYQGLATIPNDGQSITVRFNVTNGASATLAADGGTAYALQTTPGTAVSAGVLLAGTPYRLTFNLASTAWVLQDFYNSTIGPASIATSNLQDRAVTYGKIQLPSTTSLLLGTPSVASQTISTTANNGSGLIRLTVASTTGYVTGNKKTVSGVLGTTEANGYWTITVIDATHIDLQGSTFTNAYVSGGFIGGFVEEIALGSGLAMNANVLSAPAFPPPGSFKNLVIKVASTTTVTVSADFVTTTNGTLYQTTAVSCTINLGTTGINALDTGVIAIDSWYYVWVLAKADGTTGCSGSLQSTANGTFTGNLPSGYTYYGRIGAVQTIHATATLYGTWQFGRSARYVVGLAQTTTLPVLSTSANIGSVTVPTWAPLAVGRFVPPTASQFVVTALVKNGTIIAAPNNSYGPFDSTSNPPPISANTPNTQIMTVPFLLESTNIYYATLSGGNYSLACYGWEDNI